MPSNINDLPPDLGQTLTELRNTAGLKQADIARSLSINQSRVSRIEKGEVSPSEGEIQGYLSAIGTEDAQAYLTFLKQPWEHLDRPLYRHPQRHALCKAETYLQKLKEFKSKPNAPGLLMRQAQMYHDSLWYEGKYLTSLKHSITYIGVIGVGKTTAVCKQTGLVLPEAESFDRQIVLETGAGGTTVCEVRIRRGSNFEIRVEPMPDIEIYKLVEDLCVGLTNNASEEQEAQDKGVSKEIERTLRNMAGLIPGRRAGASGKKEKFDPLMDIAQACNNQAADLNREFYERLKLKERTRREILFEETSKQKGLEWLQTTFAEINYGRHRDFSLPQRIDVIVPHEVFESSNYELEIVDTKGVDETAIRQDLKNYLDDPRNLTVLCSKFSDAPHTSIQSLIENLIETGSKRVLKERVILLVLPRDGEAKAMKDDAGYAAETEEEGYELKHDQVQEKLQSIGGSGIPIYFFNAQSSEPTLITKALIERLKELRVAHVERISNVAAAIDDLIENQEERNAEAAQKEVYKSLKNFVKRYRNLKSDGWRVDNYLVRDVKTAHARKVWATTRREGTWNSLDVYFLLGNGARTLAWSRTQQAFSGLKEIVNDMLDNPDLQPAHNFLKELVANWNLWHEKFLESAQRIGEQTFRYELSNSPIWANCANTYGEGINFRRYFITQIQRWFNEPEQKHLHEFLKDRIEKAWQKEVLEQLEKLSDDGARTE